ncbi:hypothetical protein TCA2_4449 [Paenibacillus sp. TCA20]|uniref:Protein RecA n=1 Tax=Paenibacillus urinalis TaxID=521520 RepID=A0ABY7XHN3_9BACL|nr:MULTISPECIES: hypothetical protein [Paenibacillus]WDI05214.1 DNA recombination/repair protein RecA [Paenibacillus urinalis]GAK41957.1 hypothetical protein TCA2_4449 [Paenibacillus sp. TCA20]
MAATTKAKKNDEKESAKPKNPVMMDNKAIQADFNKRFGEGTFFTLEGNERTQVTPIPSGIPAFDFATGIGGVPSGRIIEIYGPESSGKTSLCLMLAGKFQELAKLPGPFFGKKVGFIDAEHALDPYHVSNLGVDTSANGMLINQPETGEGAFDLMEAMCLSEQFGLVIVDSAAALVPLAEVENDMEYNPIGLQARMLGKGLRKLKGPAQKTGTTFIFINQLRQKPGLKGAVVNTTPGGLALRFYASMRIEVKATKIEKGGSEVGLATTLHFKKNKVAVPFTTAEYDYYWVGGVDRVKNIMDVACDLDIIHRKGAYYFYGADPDDSKNPFTDGSGNELKWQGKEQLLQALRVSPALYEYTNNLVLGNIPSDTVFVDESDSDEEPDDLEGATEEEVLL